MVPESDGVGHVRVGSRHTVGEAYGSREPQGIRNHRGGLRDCRAATSFSTISPSSRWRKQ